MMTVKQLQAFLAVAESGSFQAAARRLHTSQPGISRRIAELEHALGTRLFERTTRTCHVTPRGRLLVLYARGILRDLTEISTTIAEPGGVAGLVRIGIVETIALTKLPDLLGRLALEHPEIAVDIEVDVTGVLVRRLLSREIDLALLVAPLAEPGISTEPLWHMELGWFGAVSRPPLARPLTFEDLARECVIVHTRSRHGSVVQRWFREAGIRPRRVVGCSSLAAMIRVIASGIGIGLVPRAAVEDAAVAVPLVSIATTLELPRNLSMMAFHADEIKPATRACLRSIGAAAGRLTPGGTG
jgi:DNA-binding transcriptional LysR family regulator